MDHKSITNRFANIRESFIRDELEKRIRDLFEAIRDGFERRLKYSGRPFGFAQDLHYLYLKYSGRLRCLLHMLPVLF